MKVSNLHKRIASVLCALVAACSARSTAVSGEQVLPPVTAIAPNFYYHDLQEAKKWYVDKIGFRPIYIDDWLVMVEVAPGMEIALVDGVAGSLKPVADKGAMLTIETEELEEWYRHIDGIEGIEWFSYKVSDGPSQPAHGIREHDTIEEFRILDPGGYIIEFYRWKPEFRPSRTHENKASK